MPGGAEVPFSISTSKTQRGTRDVADIDPYNYSDGQRGSRF